MTAYRCGYKDGLQGRAYGWRSDDDWRDMERDHYQDGYMAGANDRADERGMEEYYRPEGGTTRRVG